VGSIERRSEVTKTCTTVKLSEPSGKCGKPAIYVEVRAEVTYGNGATRTVRV
jgi:hypothetical protein